MELRKIQEMGGGTALVSLPKEWVKMNNLRKGSLLSIERTPDNRILIYPHQKEEHESRRIDIPYPAEYREYLLNQITGAYLMGYDIITIQARERMSYQDREMIKTAVRHLVGLEIVEEDAHSITTQFLPEPATLNPEKILRRISMISRGMHRDAITALLEKDEHLVKVVAERDDEVDRSYFLLVRLIRSAVMDPRLASSFKLSPIDCLDYRVAANLLESIGDRSTDLARTVSKMQSLSLSPEVSKKLDEASRLLEEEQDLALKTFLTRRAEAARGVVRLSGDLQKTLADLEQSTTSMSNTLRSPILDIVSSMNSIRKYHIDIADLAVPMYPIVR
ncbi:MAG: PhoU domain-containing protein [Nitrososphaerales archaeon]